MKVQAFGYLTGGLFGLQMMPCKLSIRLEIMFDCLLVEDCAIDSHAFALAKLTLVGPHYRRLQF